MLKIWITLVMTLLCGSFAFAGDGGNYCDEAEEAMWGNNAFNTGNATNSGYEMPNEDACPDQFLDWGDSPDRWFWFVPDVDEINLHTCQSGSYDTSLVVYEGDDCLSLVQVGCSGDGSGLDGCQAYYSHIEALSVTPGQTYYIRLGGWQGASGTGTLVITPGAGTIPGACCDMEGNCSQGTLADCLDSGGIFAGADSVCSSVDCTEYTGACCIGDTCYQIAAPLCDQQSGLYAGDGTDCGDFDCDEFLGACCAFDDCFVGSEVDCDTFDGTFYGYGSGCEDVTDCGPDVGACCVGEECQADRTELQCDQVNGEWQGVNSNCFNVDCTDGGGSGDPGDECDTAFDLQIGDNPFNTAAASVSDYPAPQESQCTGTYLDWADSKDVWFRYESFGYGLMRLDTCQSGSYDTSMAVYKGTDCTALQQIDCNGDGSGLNGCQAYYSYIEEISITYGETYWVRLGGWNGASGSGVLHVELLDTGNLPGACCMPDESCMETVGNVCGVAGGIFFLDATCGQLDCSNPQDAGACCIGGDCFYMTASDCDLFAGTYFSVNTSCDDIDCNDPVGACCVGDNCFPSTPNSCAAAGGEFQGEGATCEDIMCGCPGDVTGDGLADTNDVLDIIGHWGELGHSPWDLDGDGEVAVEDLLIVIAWFNQC